MNEQGTFCQSLCSVSCVRSVSAGTFGYNRDDLSYSFYDLLQVRESGTTTRYGKKAGSSYYFSSRGKFPLSSIGKVQFNCHPEQPLRVVIANKVKQNKSKQSEVILSSLFIVIPSKSKEHSSPSFRAKRRNTIHCHSGQSEGTFSLFLYLPYTFPIPAVYHLYVKRPKTQ